MAGESAFCPSGRGFSLSREIDALIVRVAAPQRGRVARRQLLAAGVNRRAIDNRIRSGILIPLYRGVYAVGHRSPDRLAALWAAWLYVGEDAVFSHQSGGELLEIHDTSSALIALTTPRQVRSRRGLWVHRGSLPADEITRRHGLPVTTISRTVLDLAAVLAPRPLERVMEECVRREFGDAIGFDGILARYPGRRGAGRLRAVLAQWRPGTSWTRSPLEEHFIVFLDARGIPRGEANAYVQTEHRAYECDHVWRKQRVVVELDSRAHHANEVALEVDSAKRRAVAAEGWTVVVVTSRQLERQPEVVARDLSALLRQERSGRGVSRA